MIIVDPVRKFLVKEQVCQLTNYYLSASVANNQQVVAAVSGKRIRVMGLWGISGGAGISSCTLKSASGGTALQSFTLPANTSAQPNVQMPVVDSGYYETVTGEGLFLDVATTAALINVQVIIYTPTS